VTSNKLKLPASYQRILRTEFDQIIRKSADPNGKITEWHVTPSQETEYVFESIPELTINSLNNPVKSHQRLLSWSNQVESNFAKTSRAI